MRSHAILPLALLCACTDMGPARVDAPADTTAGEVAFTMAGSGGAALVVPVHLNGTGPYDFVLDTGATVTCIDESLMNELQLEPVRGVRGTAAGIGGQGQLQLVNLDSMRIGNAAAHELQACVVDLQHLEGLGLQIDGLVGLNMLANFRVALDFERSVITLTAP